MPAGHSPGCQVNAAREAHAQICWTARVQLQVCGLCTWLHMQVLVLASTQRSSCQQEPGAAEGQGRSCCKTYAEASRSLRPADDHATRVLLPASCSTPQACAAGPASREACLQTCGTADFTSGELQGLPCANPPTSPPAHGTPVGEGPQSFPHLEDGRLPLIELVPPLQQPLGVFQLPLLLLKGGPGEVGEAPAGQGLQAFAEQVAAPLAVPLALLHDGPVAPQGPALCALDKSKSCCLCAAMWEANCPQLQMDMEGPLCAPW